MGRYVALLRGINVGGKNLIKMAALAECFEGKGFRDVVTYIQSGNVVFSAAGRRAALEALIERHLSETFGYQASVVLRSDQQMRDIVARAPKGFGREPEKYRYDVIFLKDSLAPKEALAEVPLKEGVDTAAAGPGVLYASRLVSRASQSRLGKIVALPMYKSLTIRNWNTTTKLLALVSGAWGQRGTPK